MENPTSRDQVMELDPAIAQGFSLRDRHASALARLMEQRGDLRGTYAFADLVDDSLRWSA